MWTNPRTAASSAERKLVSPPFREVVERKWGQGRKRKSRPSRACKASVLKQEMASMENGIFLRSADRLGEDGGQRT